jgi:phage terminase large subunit-like protein
VRELVEQLVAFPNAPHDDKVDSFYYSVVDTGPKITLFKR